MAIVTLDELWVHRVSNLATFLRIYMGSLSEESGISGEVRRYANGVTRAITTTSTIRRVSVQLPFLARADLATIEGWVGSPVMLRDPLGRKIFGVFFSVEAEDAPIGDVSAVRSASFELSALSLSEEV